MVNCQLCNKSFSRGSELNRHNRTVHLKQLQICEVCGKRMRSDHLMFHMATHRKVKPVQLCEFCGMSFDQKCEFNRHQKLQHSKKSVPTLKVNKKHRPHKQHQMQISQKKNDEDPTKRCEICSVNVPVKKWHSHLRTVIHKMKAATSLNNGLKVVKSSFKNRIETLILENTNESCLNPAEFFQEGSTVIISTLHRLLLQHVAFKFNLELFAEYIQKKEDDDEFSIKSFQTKMEIILNQSDIEPVFDLMKNQILSQMDEFQERNSGWSLIIIHHLEININQYKPLRGSSYLPLPKSIFQKKACINVKNNDEYCFKWAIISALSPVEKNSDRCSSYLISDIGSSAIKLFNNIIINFGNLEFPLQVDNISVFETLNTDISINVFGVDEKDNIVGPYYCTKAEKQTHVNLLLLQSEEQSHYVWIKNISRLVKCQITKHNRQIYICNSCLIHFTSMERLAEHRNECNKMVTTMPSLENNIIEYKSVRRELEVPFVIYADFECILQDVNTCLPNPSSSFTNTIQQHVPCAFAYYIKCNFDDSFNKLEVYKGTDSPKKFVRALTEDVKFLYDNVIKHPKPMNPLSDLEKQIYNESKECHICKTELGLDKVADHCHFTGKYRGPAHSQCNLAYQISKFFAIFFHNFSGYDCHLIVKALNEVDGDIKLIPLNKELYISLSKRVRLEAGPYDKGTIELRFLDSARFMQSSLEKLAQNLSLSDFRSIRSVFKDNEQFELVTRKGVLPYEYLNSWEKLDETMLPSQSNFNNKLTNTQCSDDDYEHAKKVWKKFHCSSLWDYLRIYLITDVLLLSDVFENFRKVCYNVYKLDPAHYYSAPGLAWDAMLKCTNIELDLFTDVSMYNFIKHGIRGGITQCSHRHSKANNKYMENYDTTKPSTFLLYFDANNLYGWAMSQPLPYGGFKWVKNTKDIDIMNIPENSSIGYIFEVDLDYPKELHDSHNDLPFCVENKCSPTGSFPKLIADFQNKRKYIIHYRNLQQCLQHGLKLVHIHRALQFNQSPWLKKYIDLNTHYRTQAKNEFEQGFFKTMVNSVYGKTMENVDKRKDVRIVTTWKSYRRRLGAQELISKPNFHSATVFTENMVAIQLNRINTFYDKPIYLGFVVLELSKWLMYNFHYTYMLPKYNTNLKLNYMDTDSFIYTIQTDDFYLDIKNDIANYFDTSDYPLDNKYNIPLLNKKRWGL